MIKKTIVFLVILFFFFTMVPPVWAKWECQWPVVYLFVNGINTLPEKAKENAGDLQGELVDYLREQPSSVRERVRNWQVTSVYNNSDGFFSDVSECILQVTTLDEVILKLDNVPTWWEKVKNRTQTQKDAFLMVAKLTTLMVISGDTKAERNFSIALTNPLSENYAGFFNSVFIARNELKELTGIPSLDEITKGAGASILYVSRNYQKDISKVAGEINSWKDAGYRVVIVSHSQGNLYMEEYVGRYGRGGVENVWVSPPNIKAVYNPDRVTMLKEDAMSVFFIGHRYEGNVTNYPKNLQDLLLPVSFDGLLPKVMLENNKLYADPTGHGFSSAYLGGANSINQILDDMLQSYINLADCEWVGPPPEITYMHADDIEYHAARWHKGTILDPWSYWIYDDITINYYLKSTVDGIETRFYATSDYPYDNRKKCRSNDDGRNYIYLGKHRASEGSHTRIFQVPQLEEHLVDSRYYLYTETEGGDCFNSNKVVRVIDSEEYHINEGFRIIE